MPHDKCLSTYAITFQQVCYLIFASWSMDGSKLLLYPMNDTDNLELYIRNTEWDLTDFAVKSYEKIYDCCPYAFPGWHMLRA